MQKLFYIITSLLLASILSVCAYCLWFRDGGQRYYYMGNDNGLIILRNGISLFVDTRDSKITHRLIKTGKWEYRDLKLVEKYLHADSQVIEVGSNVGYYTMHFSQALRKMSGKGHVYAFEANPNLVALLTRSAEANKASNTTIFNNIVYSSSGKKMQFTFDEINIGMGRVNSKVDYPKFSKKHIFEAITTTLDDTLTDKEYDIIRMDAEGSELEILKGAQRILARSPALIVFMEWARDALQNNSDIEASIDYYTNNGYKFYKIQGSKLQAISKKELLEVGICNIAMTKKDL